MPSKPTIVTIYALAATVVLIAWAGHAFSRGRLLRADADRAAVLAAPVPELRLQGRTLAEVVDSLSKSAGVEIALDVPALRAAGVEADYPMSLVLYDLPLQRMLELMLADINRFSNARWMWEGGRILITTGEVVSNQEVVIRVYDPAGIPDVLMPDGPPPNICFGGAATTGSGGGSAGGGLFGAASSPPTLDAPDRRFNGLCDLISQTVTPEAWRQHGGSASDVQVIDGRLIVTATPAAQREIAALLERLRHAEDEE
jgi:hypothetical protein